MKKIVSLISILALTVFPFTINTSAANQPVNQLTANQQIEYYSDGSYAITTLTENPVNRASKGGSKSYSYYNSDNVLAWRVTLDGTFYYDGGTSSCTSSSVYYTIYNNIWKVTSAVASRSSNKAIGDFTVKRYLLLVPVQTETVRLTITCSPNGTLS